MPVAHIVEFKKFKNNEMQISWYGWLHDIITPDYNVEKERTNWKLPNQCTLHLLDRKKGCMSIFINKNV